jgi:FkbH-like protein
MQLIDSQTEIFIFTNFTSQSLTNEFVNEVQKRKLNYKVSSCNFNQIIQAISALPRNTQNRRVIFILTRAESFDESYNFRTSKIESDKLHSRYSDFLAMLKVAIINLDAEIHLSNLFELGTIIKARSYNHFCGFELIRPVDEIFSNFISQNNAVTYLDIESNIRELGLKKSWNRSQDYLFRQPLSLELTKLLVFKFLSITKTKDFTGIKIIATDADGTLWKGVIGENDVSEIEVGHDYPGRAFLNYQMFLKDKKESGVILTLVTKNNQEDVIEFFLSRPDMPLKLEDFTIIKAGWESKAKFLSEISNDTNIPVDSILFIDDSEIEIDFVRQMIPDIPTLLLDKKEENRESQIAELSYRWSGGATFEDLNRTEMLKANLLRKEFIENSDPTEFLNNLNLEITIGSITGRADSRFERTLQLINKTNQFNMTAIRFSSEQLVVAIEEGVVFYGELSDRFGEYGLVGVAIVEFEDFATAVIRNLLFSCRALGRNAEGIFFQEIIKSFHLSRQDKIKALRYETTKNEQTKDFYSNFGFQVKRDPNLLEKSEIYHSSKADILFKEYSAKVVWR